MPEAVRIKALLATMLALALTTMMPVRAGPPGEAAGASLAAARLVDRLAGIGAYRGRFEQSVRGANGRLVDRSAGEVAFERPGHLRWHVREPYEQLLVSDGESVWFYDPDLEQATRRKLGADIAQLPGLLLTGRADALAERFAVSVEDSEGTTFVLQPLATESSALVRASLHFEEGALTALELLDAIGNSTHVQLRGQRVDHLPKRLFEFHPPDGVDVVDARGE